MSITCLPLHHGCDQTARMPDAGKPFKNAAVDALRWVVGLRLPARTGSWWVSTPAADALPEDHLYSGTAGVLHALAGARLAGIHDFDNAGDEAAAHLSAASRAPVSNPGLYVGSAGLGASLAAWGDRDAADAAFRALAAHWRPERGWSPGNDIIFGDAGVLTAALAHGPDDTRGVVAEAARRLARLGRKADGGLDWYCTEEHPRVMPGFSHGTAGVGYALARAVEVLADDELLPTAVAAGQRMVRLGDRGDGTWLAPHSIPQAPHAAPHSLGWCHGPTGSLRLFTVLQRLQPDDGWDEWVGAARRAVRCSGLPARTEPGFWDNIGQCCGTAGVGEMALDAYVETKDDAWLSWAIELGQDVLARAITDETGTRWSNTAHQASPPELEPEVGWSQGAAGISAFLLRLAGLCQDPSTPTLRLPDAM